MTGKKVFMLSTTSCGYCKQAKSMVAMNYPDIEEGKFEYFEYDKSPPTDELGKVLAKARELKVRGVPFTVLFEDGMITKAVRGFNPNGIEELIKEATGVVKEEE